jgi:hypothetical protein
MLHDTDLLVGVAKNTLAISNSRGHDDPDGSITLHHDALRRTPAWTWTGRVMGVTIDYEHRFEPDELTKTRMVWTVRNRRSRLGVRERLFAAIYGRLIARAWPNFVSWLSARTER